MVFLLLGTDGDLLLFRLVLASSSSRSLCTSFIHLLAASSCSFCLLIASTILLIFILLILLPSSGSSSGSSGSSTIGTGVRLHAGMQAFDNSSATARRISSVCRSPYLFEQLLCPTRYSFAFKQMAGEGWSLPQM